MTTNTYIPSVKTKLALIVAMSELNKHFMLKTSDRAPNRAHCRAVCDLAIVASQQDKEGFVALAKELSFNNLNRFMMAATGRPYKDRRSGKKTGGQFQAEEIANQCLSELAFFLNLPRPDVRYGTTGNGMTAALKVRSKAVKPAPKTRRRQATAAKKAS